MSPRFYSKRSGTYIKYKDFLDTFCSTDANATYIKCVLVSSIRLWELSQQVSVAGQCKGKFCFISEMLTLMHQNTTYLILRGTK